MVDVLSSVHEGKAGQIYLLKVGGELTTIFFIV